MIDQIFANVFGYLLVAGLLYGIWKANARRWSRLAERYAVDSEANVEQMDRVARRTMQTVILTGRHIGWNSYKGIVTVSVTREGIRLSLMKLFSLFHRPLLIPYRDCQVDPKRWYLIGGTASQYSFATVPDVQIIVPADLQAWIETELARLLEEDRERLSESAIEASESAPLVMSR